MVLHRIVRPAWKQPRNGGPLVAMLPVRAQDDRVLSRGEGTVVDGGAELVAPPQPAGFPGPAGDAGADGRPILGAVQLHQLRQLRILFRVPCSLDLFIHIHFLFKGR